MLSNTYSAFRLTEQITRWGGALPEMLYTHKAFLDRSMTQHYWSHKGAAGDGSGGSAARAETLFIYRSVLAGWHCYADVHNSEGSIHVVAYAQRLRMQKIGSRLADRRLITTPPTRKAPHQPASQRTKAERLPGSRDLPSRLPSCSVETQSSCARRSRLVDSRG
jgi:hypothetical protein